MAIVQVKDATGSVLDWMVAKCEGYRATIKSNEVVYVHPSDEWHHNGNWCPSRNWAQGGPIIEKLRGDSYHSFLIENDGGDVHILSWPTAHVFFKGHGETLLIAAMRCYVTSKLGNTVEVPDELI